MLSIGKVTSSAAAVSYFEEDDYYSEDLEPEKAESEVTPNSLAQESLDASPATARPADHKARKPPLIAGVGGTPVAAPYIQTSAPRASDNEGPSQTTAPSSQAEDRAPGRPPPGRGEWYGRGAQTLGLRGDVEREEFRNVLQGHLPNGAKIRSTNDRATEHVPGWDLTFSAPKSISILAEVGRDERLFDAHRAAVHEALLWVEANALAYRKRNVFGMRREIVSASMVAALFQHDTSRLQDPDLHTHAVVANATQRKDGRWSAVHSHPLYVHKMAAGIVYRAALAREVQRLGYEIAVDRRSGLFEATAVPEGVVKDFQRRRDQIKEWLAEKGASGAEASARAALATRHKKRNIAREALLRQWREVTHQHAFDVRARVRAAGQNGPVEPPIRSWSSPEVAVRDAIEFLSEAEAVFSHPDLVQRALANALGSADVASIEQAIAQERASGQLQQLDDEGRVHWTTPRALTRETRIIKALQEGRGKVPAVSTSGQVNRALDNPESQQGKVLNAGQRAAARLILTTRDRFVGVIGLPGTGKTTMLQQVRRHAESRGYSLTGMASNSEAARKLEQESGIRSSTMQLHLVSVGRDLTQLRSAGKLASRAIRARYHNQIWVVDEASQVGSALARRLTFAAERLGARVVLLGDPKQLAAIDAGKPFVLGLKRGMSTAVMDKIQRQRDPRHIEAIRHLAADELDKSIQRLVPDIRKKKDPEARIKAILAHYRSLPPERARNSLVLTARNEDKATLNYGIRDILVARGELEQGIPLQRLQRIFSGHTERKFAHTYKPGQIVRFSSDAPEAGIKRGDYFEVQTVDAKANVLTLRSTGDLESRSIRWNPREVPGRSKRVEIYEHRDASVAAGEVIRWSLVSRDIGLTNGQSLKVNRASDNRLEVQTDDGRTIELDQRDFSKRHWDYAYASTTYSSQGSTAEFDVLVNADSEQGRLFSRKAFMVAISRHRTSLTLYVDDLEKLSKTLTRHLGDKTSAIESRDSTRLTRAAALLERISADWRRTGALQRQPISKVRQ
jgi:conjugative relaxase-like TrwC/TraI family protein